MPSRVLIGLAPLRCQPLYYSWEMVVTKSSSGLSYKMKSVRSCNLSRLFLMKPLPSLALVGYAMISSTRLVGYLSQIQHAIVDNCSVKSYSIRKVTRAR